MTKKKHGNSDSSVVVENNDKSPESLDLSGRSARPKRSSGKSKREQLIALVSRVKGARMDLLIEKLGWQAHTVRAAISRLRKQGFDIERTRERRSGKPGYVVKQEGGLGDVPAAGRAHG